MTAIPSPPTHPSLPIPVPYLSPQRCPTEGGPILGVPTAVYPEGPLSVEGMRPGSPQPGTLVP